MNRLTSYSLSWLSGTYRKAAGIVMPESLTASGKKFLSLFLLCGIVGTSPAFAQAAAYQENAASQGAGMASAGDPAAAAPGNSADQNIDAVTGATIAPTETGAMSPDNAPSPQQEALAAAAPQEAAPASPQQDQAASSQSDADPAQGQMPPDNSASSAQANGQVVDPATADLSSGISPQQDPAAGQTPPPQDSTSAGQAPPQSPPEATPPSGNNPAPQSSGNDSAGTAGNTPEAAQAQGGGAQENSKWQPGQPETPCFPINSVNYSTADGKIPAALTWLLRLPVPGLGQCLGSQGINYIIRTLQNEIISKGFVTTRLMAGKQNLKSGTLMLILIPGIVRHVRFAEGTSPNARIWNAVPAIEGGVFNVHDLEQGVENLKRLSTVQADFKIEPGQNVGESDVVLAWNQDRKFHVGLQANNTMGATIGGNVSIDNPLLLNDTLQVNANTNANQGAPNAMHSVNATYSIPYGYWLLSVNANYSEHSQVVQGYNQNYNYWGESLSGESKLSYILSRDATSKTTAFVKAGYKSSDNSINQTQISVQDQRSPYLGIGVTRTQYIGNAVIEGTVSYQQYLNTLGAIPPPEAKANEVTPMPRLLTTDLDVSMPFTVGGQSLRYIAQEHSQYGFNDPMTSADQMFIGNAWTVRGFDGTSTLAGENGLDLRQELGMMLGSSGQELYTGVDLARVWGAATLQTTGAESQNLGGVFMGVRGSLQNLLPGANYDIFVGHAFLMPTWFKTSPYTLGFNVNWQY